MKFKKQVYLLQNCIYSLNFTVYYKSFLLTSVHFLYDAFIFLNIFYIPYWSGCHLPVVLYGCLHNGLENGKSWRREMTQSDSLLLRIWKEHFQIKKTLLQMVFWKHTSRRHVGSSLSLHGLLSLYYTIKIPSGSTYFYIFFLSNRNKSDECMYGHMKRTED